MNWFNDIGFYAIGSCETNNLNFNAARFTKLKLNKTRDNLDIYLQIVLFFNDANGVDIRLQEMGLIACQESSEGTYCSYRPYPETKRMLNLTYVATDSEVDVLGFGTLKRVGTNFPWQDFELTIGNDFPIEELRGQTVRGGKVQVNFNNLDKNSARLCPKN